MQGDQCGEQLFQQGGLHGGLFIAVAQHARASANGSDGRRAERMVVERESGGYPVEAAVDDPLALIDALGHAAAYHHADLVPEHAGRRMDAELVPVSYTHLDVYKRQVAGLLRPSA